MYKKNKHPNGIQLAGVSEKTLYMARDYNDITIRFLLHYPCLVDADILRTATKELIDSTEMLHSSFHVNSIIAWWKEHSQFLPSDYFQHIKTSDDLKMCAKKFALQAVKPEYKTKLQCALVQNTNESIIVITISHLCVDGMDAVYLLEKLIEDYNLIQSGRRKKLHIKTGSRAPELIYEGCSKEELQMLMKQPFNDINTYFPYSSNISGNPRMISSQIPADTMKAARSKGKKQGSTVNDLLLTAYARAVTSLPAMNTTPIRIASMMNLRYCCLNPESLGLSNTGGTFSTIITGTTEDDYTKILSEVTAQTQKVKENPLLAMLGQPLLHKACRILPMVLLMKLAKRVFGDMSLSLTNIGKVSSERLKIGEVAPDDCIFGGPLKSKPGLQIAAIGMDDTCTLCICGEYTDEDEAILQRFLKQITQEIKDYAECQETDNHF